MTKSERKNWIINIENSAAAISDQLGQAVVDSVFRRYGALGLWDLNPVHLPDVFSELYTIEADLRENFVSRPEQDIKLLTAWRRIT